MIPQALPQPLLYIHRYRPLIHQATMTSEIPGSLNHMPPFLFHFLRLLHLWLLVACGNSVYLLTMEALLLFCCEPCLRGDDDSRELYEVLAVDQSASGEDIRTAYRRRALELHPDKLKQKGVTVTAQHNEDVRCAP